MMHDRLTEPQSPQQIVPLGRTERLMGVHSVGATRVIEAERDDEIEVGMTIQPTSLGSDLQVDPAITAVIVDHALASAIRANPHMLGSLATTQLHFDILRPFPAIGSLMRATAHAPIVDSGGGYARAILADEKGTEFASASGWFIEVQRDNPIQLAEFLDVAEQDIDYSEYNSLAATVRLQTVEALQKSAEEGTFTHHVEFGEAPYLLNENGTLHGGALTMMGIVAAQMSMSDSQKYLLQSVQIDFLRAASGSILCKIHPRYLGRRFRSIDIQIETHQGVVATMSCGFRLQ